MRTTKRGCLDKFITEGQCFDFLSKQYENSGTHKHTHAHRHVILTITEHLFYVFHALLVVQFLLFHGRWEQLVQLYCVWVELTFRLPTVSMRGRFPCAQHTVKRKQWKKKIILKMYLFDETFAGNITKMLFVTCYELIKSTKSKCFDSVVASF